MTAAETPTIGMTNARLPRDLNAMMLAIAASELWSVGESFDVMFREQITKRFEQLPKETQARALARLKS